MIRSGLLFAALALGGPAAQGSPEGPAGKAEVGEEAPELVVSRGAWMGWDSDLKLADLRGHVVWLEFGFLH
jgi:hypothetical protein